MTSETEEYSTEAQLRETFEEVGAVLEYSADAYLIGGGAMTLRGTKPSTKDVDLVVADEDSFKRIQAALLDADYSVETEVAPEYESLGATAVLKREGGGHVDLFDRQVALKLEFSDGMQSRATKMLSVGELTVWACAPVDVALFKMMTPRPDDTQDVRDIITANPESFDWNTVHSEFESQLPLNFGNREYEWLTENKPHPIIQFERTIRKLDGVPSQLEETVRRVADTVETEGYIIQYLRRAESVKATQLQERVVETNPTITEHVERALERLTQKGVVSRDSDTDTVELDTTWAEDTV